MVHQNSYKEGARDCESSWTRMVEGSIHESAGMKVTANIVMESAADVVRSRDDQHSKDHDVETQVSLEIRVITRAVERKSVSNVETTGNLGAKDIAVSLGKETMSSEIEVRKPHVTVAPPCSTKPCPLRSRRASLVNAHDIAAVLITEKIYRCIGNTNLPPSAAQRPALILKVSKCTWDSLVNKLLTSEHGHQLFGKLSKTVVVENKLNTASKEFQESLPLDVNIRTSGVKTMVERFNRSFNATTPNDEPVRVPLKDVNVCTGGVKNMIERFSQSSMITSSNDATLRTSPQDVKKYAGGVKNMVEKFTQSFKVTPPNDAPVRTPPEDVKMCTGGVKRMVQRFSQNSLVTSYNNTPRTLPKFKKFSTHPLESSTNPLLKDAVDSSSPPSYSDSESKFCSCAIVKASVRAQNYLESVHRSGYNRPDEILMQVSKMVELLSLATQLLRPLVNQEETI